LDKAQKDIEAQQHIAKAIQAKQQEIKVSGQLQSDIEAIQSEIAKRRNEHENQWDKEKDLFDAKKREIEARKEEFLNNKKSIISDYENQLGKVNEKLANLQIPDHNYIDAIQTELASLLKDINGTSSDNLKKLILMVARESGFSLQETGRSSLQNANYDDTIKKWLNITHVTWRGPGTDAFNKALYEKNLFLQFLCSEKCDPSSTYFSKLPEWAQKYIKRMKAMQKKLPGLKFVPKGNTLDINALKPAVEKAAEKLKTERAEKTKDREKLQRDADRLTNLINQEKEKPFEEDSSDEQIAKTLKLTIYDPEKSPKTDADFLAEIDLGELDLKLKQESQGHGLFILTTGMANAYCEIREEVLQANAAGQSKAQDLLENVNAPKNGVPKFSDEDIRKLEFTGPFSIEANGQKYNIAHSVDAFLKIDPNDKAQKLAPVREELNDHEIQNIEQEVNAELNNFNANFLNDVKKNLNGQPLLLSETGEPDQALLNTAVTKKMNDLKDLWITRHKEALQGRGISTRLEQYSKAGQTILPFYTQDGLEFDISSLQTQMGDYVKQLSPQLNAISSIGVEVMDPELAAAMSDNQRNTAIATHYQTVLKSDNSLLSWYQTEMATQFKIDPVTVSQFTELMGAYVHNLTANGNYLDPTLPGLTWFKKVNTEQNLANKTWQTKRHYEPVNT